MKVTLEIVLEGNVTLSASADIETLKDVGTLGKKLVALPTGVRKTVPDLYERKIEKLRLPKE